MNRINRKTYYASLAKENDKTGASAMTRDDIIRMAREADLFERVKDGAGYVVRIPNVEKLERFAALVAQREEDACAFACQSVVVYYEKQGNSKAVDVAWQCNDAIRWSGEP